MFDRSTERRRIALRAAIQMGGARVTLSQAEEDNLTTVAFWLTDEDTCKCIAWMFKEGSPAQRITEFRRRLMSEGFFDGNNWKDWR